MLNNLHRYVALEINTVKYVLDINKSLSWHKKGLSTPKSWMILCKLLSMDVGIWNKSNSPKKKKLSLKSCVAGEIFC